MSKTMINPPAVHPPVMAYSHAVRANKTIYVSAQLPLDKDGKLVGPGDAQQQSEQVFANLKAVLAAAGADLTDVVKLTTFLTDLAHRPAAMQVRKRFFGPHHAPSLLAIVGDLPVQGALVQVEAIAVVD